MSDATTAAAPTPFAGYRLNGIYPDATFVECGADCMARLDGKGHPKHAQLLIVAPALLEQLQQALAHIEWLYGLADATEFDVEATKRVAASAFADIKAR